MELRSKDNGKQITYVLLGLILIWFILRGCNDKRDEYNGYHKSEAEMNVIR